jgi:aerobic carbon-monoxide dehydrogenase small subunit
LKTTVRLTINGRAYELEIEPRTLLLDLLHDQLNLTGARRGCESSYCGACSVLLDGMVVHSCSVLAIAAQGRDITTIEGLAEGGELHPVQRAFIEAGAIQCGYCTPGLILATCSLLRANPSPSEVEIKGWLLGNICRCTGYQKVVAAVQRAAQPAGRR